MPASRWRGGAKKGANPKGKAPGKLNDQRSGSRSTELLARLVIEVNQSAPADGVRTCDELSSEPNSARSPAYRRRRNRRRSTANRVRRGVRWVQQSRRK